MIDYHPDKVNIIADALSKKYIVESWAMVACLSLCDGWGLLAELLVRPNLIEQIKEAQLSDIKLVNKRRLVEQSELRILTSMMMVVCDSMIK